MSFRVMARTILHLGAELISSDGIAFYELIKNAFDAQSPRVDIDVLIHIPYDTYVSQVRYIQDELKKGTTGHKSSRAIGECASTIKKEINPAAPLSKQLESRISKAQTWEQLLYELDRANRIVFKDTGSGMTRKDLIDNFLTIGTRNRQKQRYRQLEESSDDKPILGEKGLGRLSAMRLGCQLVVKSTARGEHRWNVLEIDWRKFSHDSDSLVEEIVIAPKEGREKDDPDEQGTRIQIFGLASRWSEEKLREIAKSEFSRLTDPFVPMKRYPISLQFNDQPVSIPSFNKMLFEHAHAVVNAKYSTDDNKPNLTGQVDYVLRDRKKTISLELSDLTSIAKCLPSVLKSLGSFSVEWYWFNRRILEAVDGIGDKRAVQRLVNDWSGGLMVFRDGFRVNPYGSPDDDWLDLDRKALASGGYKVNRKQIIGRVSITGRNNPALTDQTNRQGIRDGEESFALKYLLKHLFEGQFRTFLNQVDEEVRARLPLNFDELNERMLAEDKKMRKNIRLLINKYPIIAEDNEVLNALESSLELINGMLKEAQEFADSFEKGRRQLVDLAGLGLMVEVIAHELNRATHHALTTLSEADLNGLQPDASGRLNTLKSQLKTLQKRLRIIDPLSQPGRQVKEPFDLIKWIEEVVGTHDAQFTRHGIKCSVSVEPPSHSSGMMVKMVKGMIVQILENLFSNSVYWLKQQRILDKQFSPEIDILINTKRKEIHFSDNGPGIQPARSEEIFQPFVTTKPPGEGKGLGLYISREIAGYHGAALILSDKPTVHSNRLNTFILMLEVKSK